MSSLTSLLAVTVVVVVVVVVLCDLRFAICVRFRLCFVFCVFSRGQFKCAVFDATAFCFVGVMFICLFGVDQGVG
jgi:hypothetical protein